MGANARVINLTSGCRLKRSQARNRIEQCLSVWIDNGFTIRDLTLAERIQARSDQSRLSAPIPFAEIPGLRYEPSVQNQASTRLSYAILKQANQFCAQHA